MAPNLRNTWNKRSPSSAPENRTPFACNWPAALYKLRLRWFKSVN